MSNEELQKDFKKWILDSLEEDKYIQNEFIEWYYSGNWVEEEEE